MDLPSGQTLANADHTLKVYGVNFIQTVSK